MDVLQDIQAEEQYCSDQLRHFLTILMGSGDSNTTTREISSVYDCEDLLSSRL
jgi:hypothetical protein